MGLKKKKLQSIKEFLENIQSVLQSVCINIRSAQDQARVYTDKGWRNVTFDEGDKVVLKVPAQLETLKMRKCEKLSCK